MNGSRQRLQARIDELNTRWDRLSQKLNALVQQRDSETRPEEKMRMDAIIEENERERQKIEADLSQLEAQLAGTTVAPPPSREQPQQPPVVTEPKPTPKIAGPIEVFYSYSHKDEELREQLEFHLKLLKRLGVINDWHDRRIGAGTEWAGQIDHYLESSQIILLLISAYFLASDYCWDIEMKRALERHNAGTARVIPIMLRPVDWKGAPFSHLQVLPKDAKPVTDWSNQDAAFANVAEGIRKVAEELAGK
ncbi:MAG: TIR domain-containing protein [Candidatus Competibacteraceae bacterium]